MAKAKAVQTADPLILRANELAEQKLGFSGLTLADAKVLGIEVLTADDIHKFKEPHYLVAPSLLFRYWSPWEGKFTEVPKFHRLRWLEPPMIGGFPVLPKMKYTQPVGTLNEVYLPKLGAEDEVLDWLDIFSDPQQELIITEGELKAACAAKMGYPTLGLGGVTMISAKKKGASELPIFDKINWRGRTVYIIFDTDANGVKPQVLRAANVLGELLLRHGARPKIATLPHAEGQKVGLDDFLVEHGSAALVPILELSLQYSAAKMLLGAAQKYRYIKSLGCVGEIGSGRLISEKFFRTEFGNQQVERLVRRVVSAAGIRTVTPVLELQPLGASFLEWEARPDVQGVTYEPGKEEVVDDMLNLWGGWATQPVEGDVSPFWLALDNVFGDDPMAREFIEHWLFYPIKFPGTKLYTMALVVSPEEGIGKTFPAEMLARFVYGVGAHGGPVNASIVQEGDLAGAYNSFMLNKQFIVGDDVAGNEAYEQLAKIKSLVTNEHVTAKQKYIAEYMAPNKANLYVTSNQVVAFKISDNDRRMFVHNPTEARNLHAEYSKIRDWFIKEQGGGKLLWWIQNKYQAGKFDPRSKAPETAGRSQLIQMGRSDIEDWINQCMTGEMSRDFATVQELTARYMLDRHHEKQVPEQTMSRAVARANLPRWKQGQRWGTGANLQRIIIFKNPQKWANIDTALIKAEIDRKPEFKFTDVKVAPPKPAKVTQLKKEKK